MSQAHPDFLLPFPVTECGNWIGEKNTLLRASVASPSSIKICSTQQTYQSPSPLHTQLTCYLTDIFHIVNVPTVGTRKPCLHRSIYSETGTWVYPVFAKLSPVGLAAFFSLSYILFIGIYLLGEKLNHWKWGQFISLLFTETLPPYPLSIPPGNRRRN